MAAMRRGSLAAVHDSPSGGQATTKSGFCDVETNEACRVERHPRLLMNRRVVALPCDASSWPVQLFGLVTGSRRRPRSQMVLATSNGPGCRRRLVAAPVCTQRPRDEDTRMPHLATLCATAS